MARRTREHIHEATRDEIKQVARQLMAENGTAGLSLRGIAKAMDITAPALYRYFASLDVLITALIVDNFNQIADALETARDDAASQNGHYGDQMLAALLAYRRWALDHPVDFQLIYGNPIPGYEAPRELTVEPASRILRIFTGLCAEMLYSGEIQPRAPYDKVPDELQAGLLDSLRYAGVTDDHMLALYFGVVGWPRMHGIVMLEIFGHLGPVVGDMDAYYRVQMQNLMRDLGYQF